MVQNQGPTPRISSGHVASGRGRRRSLRLAPPEERTYQGGGRWHRDLWDSQAGEEPESWKILEGEWLQKNLRLDLTLTFFGGLDMVEKSSHNIPKIEERIDN